MKQVLVIDESPLFREYLWTKFSENAVDVVLSGNGRDGLAKLRTLKPDLLMLDYHIGGMDFLEVLQQKKANATVADIPVIITGEQLSQNKILELIPYNVRKVFTKPIKIDALFSAISQLLDTRFDIDMSPGQVDVHINHNFVFIEISQGLNQDKLELLQFKILELTELCRVRSPKVLVMISHTEFDTHDGPKLHTLFDVVTKISTGGQQNIRVLTKDPFLRTYLDGRKEFSKIEVAEDLTSALEGLMGNQPGTALENPVALLTELLPEQRQIGIGETVQLQFTTDSPDVDLENSGSLLKDFKIAAVDDDFVVRELLKNIFRHTGAVVSTFSDGEEYLAALEQETFDLTFLDMVMPKIDGFTVLQTMQDRHIDLPVIVLSAISQRETVIRAFKLGIKNYLVKPLAPNAIFMKTIEMLRK